MPSDRRLGGEHSPLAHRAISRRAVVGAGLALLVSSAFPDTTSARGASALRVVDDWFRPPVGETGPAQVAAEVGPTRSQAQVQTPVSPPSNALNVPFRSQHDGSPQARSNCGPASLSMLLAHLGNGTSIADLRWSINTKMGIWHNSNGSSWEAVAYAAESRGYKTTGLYSSPRVYRKWTVEDLEAESKEGCPVMILTRYKHLPGREGSPIQYNHYVVVAGFDPEGAILYHDPAYPDSSTGAFLRMTREQLDVAWSKVSTGIVYSGMSIRPPAN